MRTRVVAPRVEAMSRPAAWWRENLSKITRTAGPKAALDTAAVWLEGLSRDLARARAGTKKPGPKRRTL